MNVRHNLAARKQQLAALLKDTHVWNSAVLLGVSAVPVEVQARAVRVVPRSPKSWTAAVSVTGMPPGTARQLVTKLSAAFAEIGANSTQVDVVVNVHGVGPNEQRAVDFSSLELPIAVAVLQASGYCPAVLNASALVLFGQLDASGACRRCRGAIPIALTARKGQGVLAPSECEAEMGVLAATKTDLSAALTRSLGHAIDVLFNGVEPDPVFRHAPAGELDKVIDFSDIAGHEQAKRAAEIAVAGFHDVLLVGAPGCGKTMLSNAMRGILPPMGEQEQLEVLQVYSSASQPLRLGERPFRHVHHTVSRQALVGGGSNGVEIGEVTLAHAGILFLDELPEFDRDALESLRQPLEDRQVAISRVGCKVTVPCKFMLVATMNPCPCGWSGPDGAGDRCQCSLSERARYRQRISGPLLDRFDLQVWMPSVGAKEMLAGAGGREKSVDVAKRVKAARERQLRRFQAIPDVWANGVMPAEMVMDMARLENNAKEWLIKVSDANRWSGRRISQILRVARTIADLGGADCVGLEHAAEAAMFASCWNNGDG